MGVIANASTGDARRLLKKYDQPDAINHEDLEYKLTKLYKNADDKVVLEKELAEIHPHKSFILKNLTPEEKPVEITIEKEEFSPCDGSYNKTGIDSEKSCGCGCSGFDGTTSNKNNEVTPLTNKDNTIAVMGILGIITIFAMVVIKTSKTA